jgi:hypothetical protein
MVSQKRRPEAPVTPTRRFWFTAAAVVFMVATRPTALPAFKMVSDKSPIVERFGGLPAGPGLKVLGDYVILPGGCAQPGIGSMPIALQPGCEGITGVVDPPVGRWAAAGKARFCGELRETWELNGYPEYPVVVALLEARCPPFPPFQR